MSPFKYKGLQIIVRKYLNGKLFRRCVGGHDSYLYFEGSKWKSKKVEFVSMGVG